MEISKRDWKLFREKLPAWQENYMDRLINEYIGLLSDQDKRRLINSGSLTNRSRLTGAIRE